MLRPLLALLFSFMLLVPAVAQLAPAAPGAETEVSKDPFGRSTPRGAIQGYLKAVADGDDERAGRYLGVGDATPFERKRMVSNLRLILDRSGELMPTTEIANVPAGREGDGLEADLDRIGTLGAEEVRADLMLRRVEEDGAKVWVIAPETLALLPEMMAASEVSFIERITPDAFAGVTAAGAPAGDWLALLVVAALALGAGQALTMILHWVGLLVWARGDNERTDSWLKAARWPLGLSFGVAIFKAVTLALGISVVAREFAGRWADIAAVVGGVWFLMTVVDHGLSTVTNRAGRRARQSAVSALRLVRRVAKAVLAMFGLMVILDIFGVDVSTWLAALGIGGLALALGAQKTIENLVGSVTLVADQPIRVGDFCRFGTTLGTVEDIGMRSTRIRTLERTLVTIPNGAFSSMEIENFAKRERFLFRHTLGLRYETSPDEVEAACEAVRQVLADEPAVVQDGARVVFIGLGATSLDVEAYAYMRAPDYAAFLELQGRLLVAIMRALEARAVDFAFPSQTVYLARDARSKPSVRQVQDNLAERLAKAA